MGITPRAQCRSDGVATNREACPSFPFWGQSHCKQHSRAPLSPWSHLLFHGMCSWLPCVFHPNKTVSFGVDSENPFRPSSSEVTAANGLARLDWQRFCYPMPFLTQALSSPRLGGVLYKWKMFNIPEVKSPMTCSSSAWIREDKTKQNIVLSDFQWRKYFRHQITRWAITTGCPPADYWQLNTFFTTEDAIDVSFRVPCMLILHQSAALDSSHMLVPCFWLPPLFCLVTNWISNGRKEAAQSTKQVLEERSPLSTSQIQYVPCLQRVQMSYPLVSETIALTFDPFLLDRSDSSKFKGWQYMPGAWVEITTILLFVSLCARANAHTDSHTPTHSTSHADISLLVCLSSAMVTTRSSESQHSELPGH